MGVFSELDLENQQTELDGHEFQSGRNTELAGKADPAARAEKSCRRFGSAGQGACGRSRLPKRKQSRKILRQQKQNGAVSTRKQKPNGKRNGSGSRRKNVPQKRQRLQKLSR